MENTGKLSLNKLVENFKMEVIYGTEIIDGIDITPSDVSRPGLQLVGFVEYFDNRRIQIMGKAEFTYLEQFSTDERTKKLEDFFKLGFPVLIITRGLQIFPEMSDFAEKYNVPLLRCEYGTSRFMSMIIRYLSEQLAPCKTRHGVLCEIYGEGILIMGESGVGKSEAAIELVKRGHRLVADDAVVVKKISDKRLIGEAPENIRHMMEIRGVGIINVELMYGISAVIETKSIDLVVYLEYWDKDKDYDRLGMDEDRKEILDVSVPLLTIPVRPGRNLAIIMESAARNTRLKQSGYDALEEIRQRQMKMMEE